MMEIFFETVSNFLIFVLHLHTYGGKTDPKRRLIVDVDELMPCVINI